MTTTSPVVPDLLSVEIYVSASFTAETYKFSKIAQTNDLKRTKNILLSFAPGAPASLALPYIHHGINTS
jgi:hypothetical protein